jgi:hypothetical protein
MKKHLTLAFLVLVLAAGHAAAQRAGTPEAAAEKFYAQYLALQMRGLPTEAQSKAIDPLISKQIKDLIASDIKKQHAFIKKNPDEKPPWIEGDLFSSLFEGATEYNVGRTRIKGGAAYVDVALKRVDDSGKSEWTDTAVLRKVSGRWILTDILYKGTWQFKTGSSLLKVLK